MYPRSFVAARIHNGQMKRSIIDDLRERSLPKEDVTSENDSTYLPRWYGNSLQ